MSGDVREWGQLESTVTSLVSDTSTTMRVIEESLMDDYLAFLG